MTRFRERISSFLPVFLLLAFIVVLWGKILWTGRTVFGSDFVLFFYPLKKHVQDYLLAHGTLPFWNPYQFSGTPLVSNIQASMFYPLGFLFYLMPVETAYVYTLVIHCALGSIFMYGFVRAFSISKTAALFSALVFSFNGFFMGHLYAGHLTFVQNYIWIPVILLYAYKFITFRKFHYATISGLFLGIQILGGFPQIAFYTILGILFFGLFHVWSFLKSQRVNERIRECIRIGLGFLLILGLGFALAAVQVLPTLEFTHLSTRAGGVSYDFATYDSLHPKALLSFLVPDIFGNAVDDTYWRSPDGWHFWETCGYVGILPLFLMLIAPRTGNLGRLHLFFAGMIFLSLFVAMGKYNPLYPAIYTLPGFGRFRIPAQILFLYVFAVAAASGIGLDRDLNSDWRPGFAVKIFFILVGTILMFLVVSLHYFPYQFFFYLFKYFSDAPTELINIADVYSRVKHAVDRSAWIFLSSILLIYLIAHGKTNKKFIGSLAIGILMIDLGLFGSQFIRPYEFDVSPEKQNIVSQLKQNPQEGRVITQSRYFTPCDGMLFGFASIQGYDPLILRRYARYIQASQGLAPNDHIVSIFDIIKDSDSKLLKLLNLKKRVQGKVIENIEPLFPYVALVPKAVIKPTEEVLSFMLSTEFDSNQMVVLESEPGAFIADENGPKNFNGSCSVLHWEDESIRIQASTNQAGYLVLNEIFYPGWTATVDGEKKPILQGNYLLRVIPLKKGEHEVRLRFVSWPFRLGAAISLLTLTGSVWIIWARGRK